MENLGILIPILGLSIPLVYYWTSHREKMWQIKNGIITDKDGNETFAPNTVDAEAMRKIEELQDRIAVLERIVVENRKSDDLAREIEALNTRPAALGRPLEKELSK